MVAMGIFPCKRKFLRQNRESNLGPHCEKSEALTTKPRGWSESIVISLNFINTFAPLFFFFQGDKYVNTCYSDDLRIPAFFFETQRLNFK
jgi:hypothetical protein